MPRPTRGPDHLSDDGAALGTERQTRVPPDARPRLSDAAIEEIAAQIARAMPLPPPDDQTTWVLASRAALPDGDEERVTHARARRTRDARHDAPRAALPGRDR